MLTLSEMIEKTNVRNGDLYTKKILQKEARIADKEEKIVTIIDGVVETINTANAGDYIVKGERGEEYVLKADKFEKLYEKVSENIYQTKREEVIAIELTEDIKFIAPWGTPMEGKKGDFIIYRNDFDAYRIEREIFFETYLRKI
jgi:hypothetical protein